GVGEHDFERERHGDRGVDRIAALFQNLHARLCRQRMSADHHGVLRSRGPRAERPRRRNGARAANDNGVRGASFGRGGFGRARIAKGIDLLVQAFRGGGRLVYVGAGTSGRLGVLDATECPPTFGTPPSLVVGVIAGGYGALVKSVEGAEDDVNAAAADMDKAAITNRDVVVGIAASGTTPYVRAALGRAQTLGARSMLVTCSTPPKALSETCDVIINPIVGPEVLTGSTRLTAGTATKLVLNP